jgi:PHD/YefM family antitoxin component YafN of YafNO toxin-antitoxin module
MRSDLPEPQIVTRNGKPVSVIISIDTYEQLLERAEDASDIAWLRKARRKPMTYRSLDEYMASRKARRRV